MDEARISPPGERASIYLLTLSWYRLQIVQMGAFASPESLTSDLQGEPHA